MPTISDTKKTKDKGKKKVRVVEDTPKSTAALRTRHPRAAATPKPKAPTGSKKTTKDAAPGSLSVHKALVLATPKAEKRMPKRGGKAAETSSDDETNEAPSSSELSGDEIAEDGSAATEAFATVIRGPPTVTDGEDAAEGSDDEKRKKRKRSRKSPTPAPQKSARKEGQTAPVRKPSVDMSEAAAASSTAPATTSTTPTTSAPAIPEPVEPAPATTSTAPTTASPAAVATTSAPAAVATTPSLTIVAGASPLKKLPADSGTKALLANAEMLQKSMDKYMELSDDDSDKAAQPSKEKQAKKDTKTKEKKKKSQKQKKDKREKEKKQSKQKSTESDIEMEGSDEIQGKNRDADSARQAIQAKIEKLQQLLADQPQPQPDTESAESDIDLTGSSESSENEDEDTKPTKKGKEPAKKGKRSTKKEAAKKPLAAEDPEAFTYYKLQGADSRKVVQGLKERFTRSMFKNWWPEGDERVTLGEEAYSNAVKAWKESVIVISSSDEMPSSKSKEKSQLRPPFKYNGDVKKMVSNFPTEVRNAVRNSTTSVVEAAYEIRKMPEDYGGTEVEYTRQAVAGLVDNFSFAKDPDDSTAIVGSHPVIVDLMTKHFGKPEYMREKEVVKLLSPMPVQCIAIMIAATRYALDRFAEGGPPKKRLAFQETPYKDIYFEALNLLLEAKKNNPAKYSSLIELHTNAMPAIGANASKCRVAAEAFKSDEEEVEE